MAWQVPYLIGYNPTSARVSHCQREILFFRLHCCQHWGSARIGTRTSTVFHVHCTAYENRTIYQLTRLIDRSVCGIINMLMTVNTTSPSPGITGTLNWQPMEQCLSKVHDWLLHNGLSPNPAKSDAVQFTTGRGVTMKTTLRLFQYRE